MPTNNERLQAILHDARLVYLSKFRMAQNLPSASNSDLNSIAQKMDVLLSYFDNPLYWLHPIPFDEPKLLALIVSIDVCDPADVAQFLASVNAFGDYLEAYVFNSAARETENVRLDALNLLVHDALKQYIRNVGGRRQYFSNQGIDLNQHSEFIVLQESQRKVMREYTEALASGRVKATEEDTRLFDRIASAIRQAEDLDSFLKIYALLTRSMNIKLPPSPSGSV